ncbi:o-succinylbenzoate--CoA ligase [Alicyclobacillus curvatus]|nr:o-succinylbenzoate--CoA ligase [Alicyclobacillus curvatus]
MAYKESYVEAVGDNAPGTVSDKVDRHLRCVPDWLTKQAMTRPNQLALEHNDGTLTYSELLRAASSVSAKLSARGIRRGDRVALLARHGLTFAMVVHGVIQVGAVLVPLNTRLTPHELGWQLNNVDASLVVADESHTSLAEAAIVAANEQRQDDEASRRQEIHELTHNSLLWVFAEHDLHPRDGQAHGVENEELLGHGVQRADESLLEYGEGPASLARATRRHATDLTQGVIELDAIHAIVHTSGTTGDPKGVQITYGNHFWSATSSALQLGLDVHERWLVPMPLFHVGGLSVLMRSLIYGTTAVLYDTFDERLVNDALSDSQITLISVVPTMLQRMLADEHRREPGKQLRCILLGGSGASEALLRRCQEQGLPVAQSYGLTEANSQVATLRPTDALSKLGSSGQPLFPCIVRIVSDDGFERGPKESGEIWVHSPTVTPGYWRRPDANAKTFVDGWLRTGDIGYVDEGGYLYVLDRRRDLIVSGGENIYPAEVENALQAYEGVLEAGVVAVSDAQWGHVPCAFVVLHEGKQVSVEELEAHCRQRIAGYKVPKHWRFVDKLPRNASGKLLRRQLSEWLKEQSR